MVKHVASSLNFDPPPTLSLQALHPSNSHHTPTGNSWNIFPTASDYMSCHRRSSRHPWGQCADSVRRVGWRPCFGGPCGRGGCCGLFGWKKRTRLAFTFWQGRNGGSGFCWVGRGDVIYLIRTLRQTSFSSSRNLYTRPGCYRDPLGMQLCCCNMLSQCRKYYLPASVSHTLWFAESSYCSEQRRWRGDSRRSIASIWRWHHTGRVGRSYWKQTNARAGRGLWCWGG